jgi:hypothetical protein
MRRANAPHGRLAQNAASSLDIAGTPGILGEIAEIRIFEHDQYAIDAFLEG